MIFFFLSLLASLFGGFSASGFSGFSYYINLNVNNPFSGILSFWPFIAGLVVILLAILWYQAIVAIRKKKSAKLNHRTSAMQSPAVLAMATVFALALLVAPWYLESISEKDSSSGLAPDDQVEMILTVHGMDCGGCEGLVNRRVAGLDGVESVSASHTSEEVVVVYNRNKVTLAQIAETIENTGYTVILE